MLEGILLNMQPLNLSPDGYGVPATNKKKTQNKKNKNYKQVW